jgi:conjugative relaxase-like TrwC/TraI family protein
MLRVTMSVSAEGARKYFDAALGTSDYYVSERGMWGGKGAERLRLTSDVSREDFVALASNRIPRTKDKNLTVRTKDKRTAGYDFCFSVPKSVSIYLAHTGDKEVERMIDESFRETMTDIESRMETRVRGKGEDGEERDYNRTTGNLIYAAFIHTVTRPIDGIPDPHYHIHGFTFNATFDEQEDRWKAGQFMNLKADAPGYEADFNARLACRLIESGYGIRRTDRDFELASVSRELIEKFSKRTRRIEQLAREKYTVIEARARALVKRTGMEFADAFAQIRSELGAQSREKKRAATLSPEEQLANWRAQMTRAERDSLLLASVRGAVSQNLVEGETAKDLAVEHLFERSSVARELHAAGMLLRRGIGRVSVEEARDFVKTDPRFVRLDPAGTLVTTREVLAEESAMIETARAGQSKFEPIERNEEWTILSPAVAQSKEQTKAVQEVLRSRDLVTAIHGPAGSGKTTLMREAVNALETLSGKDVLVLAPSASAVQVLKSEGFAKSDTFQKFIADSALQPLAKGLILWVDEAGFLSDKRTTPARQEHDKAA